MVSGCITWVALSGLGQSFGHPYALCAITSAKSKATWCPPQSDDKLMAEKQILSFKPAPRFEQVGYIH
jgi:hypothetical protein